MRRFYIICASVTILFAILTPISAVSQTQDDEPMLTMRERKLNGPRLGMTYVLPGSVFDRKLDEKHIDNFISQFGWHFEWLVTPQGGGPSFVTQLMPFLGGVEYSTVIPSLSLVLGIRMPFGLEFGMGPNVLFTFDRHEPVNTTLLVAIGQSLKFGGVQIPLNLALSTNRDGQRLSAVFGYAIPSRRRTLPAVASAL